MKDKIINRSMVLTLKQALLLEGILKTNKATKLMEIAKTQNLYGTEKTIRTDFYVVQDYANTYHVEIDLDHGNVMNIGRKKDRDALLAHLVKQYKDGQLVYNIWRDQLIMLDCLTKEEIPSLNDWCTRFNYSKPQVLNDIKKAKEKLEHFNIILSSDGFKGYRIAAEESDIRSGVVAVIEEMFGDNISAILMERSNDSIEYNIWQEIFPNINLDDIYESIATFRDTYDLHFRAPEYINIVLYSAIMFQRIANENIIDKKLYKFADPEMIATGKGYFQSLMDEEADNEINYLIYDIVLPKVRTSTHNIPDFETKINDITKQTMEYAYQLMHLNIFLNEVFQNEFSRNVINLLQYDGKMHDSFNIPDEVMAKDHFYGMMIARYFTQIAEKEKILVPKEKINVITLLISVELEKIKYYAKKKTKAVLVSANAVSASFMLYWQLLNNFSQELDISSIVSYEMLPDFAFNNIELIITTIPLKNFKIPSIVVPPMLSEEDMEHLHAAIYYQDLTIQHPNFHYIFDSKSSNEDELFTNISKSLSDDINKQQEIEKHLHANYIYNDVIIQDFDDICFLNPGNHLIDNPILLYVTDKPINIKTINNKQESRIFILNGFYSNDDFLNLKVLSGISTLIGDNSTYQWSDAVDSESFETNIQYTLRNDIYLNAFVNASQE